jgi:hypothetical protein
MRTIRRLCTVALVSGLTLLGLGVAPAAARPIEQEHFHDSFSEVFENCGLTLRQDVDVEGMFQYNSQGPDGLTYFSQVSHGTVSWTNLANGKTMTASFAGVFKDLEVTDNGDGTLTIVSMSSGNYKVVGPDGGAALRMVTGTIRFEVLVDHGGTPTDPSDDDQLDFQIIMEQTGLNELAGGDFFCDDVQLLIG